MPRKEFIGGKGRGKQKQNLEQTDEAEAAVFGTENADYLTGTDGPDILHGLGGDDTLDGGASLNIMDGGEGSDTYLVKSAGGILRVSDTGESLDIDTIAAGTASRTISLDGFDPSSGVEVISSGGYFNVHISGTGESDLLDFSQTELDGIAGILGLRGDDTILGSQGDDLIAGGAGNDVLAGNDGNDTLDGGSGADTFVLQSGEGIDVVADFSLEEGDKLDISHAGADENFAGWDVSTHNEEGEDPVALLTALYVDGTSEDLAILSGFEADEADEDLLEDALIF